jgi:glycosyltransferase involved in cell wall biosynthesis
MRVAIWHDLPSGGGLRAMVGQVRELIAMGHDVSVWSPATSPSSFSRDWWPAQVPHHIRPIAESWRPGYLDRRFGGIPNAWRGEALTTHARAVTGEMREWNPDVLLVHPCTWFHASPLALHWHGASVLYLQEPYRPLYEALPENPWAALPVTSGGCYRSRLGRLVRDQRQLTANRRQVREEVAWVRAFDRVLVNSLYSRECVSRAYGIDSVYCPLGADHGALPSLPMSKQPFVVSLGQLSPHKDARLAVAAVAKVPRDRRPQLRWFGNRHDQGYLEQVQADAKSLDVDFRFELSVPDGELSVQMAQAACFVFCARLEPLGLSPLEANLAGTSVVAVAEGGVRETIIDGVNGTLVYNRDAAAMGAAIDRYVSDLPWATAQGKRAREHVLATHSWKRAGVALELELKNAMYGAGAPI